MDNQIENQVEVRPQNKKNGKGLISVVVILVLLVLGFGGYIVYDKVFNKETKEPEKTETKVEDNTLKEPSYDLSNVPQTSAQCTSEFTLDEYYKLVENVNGTDENLDNIEKHECDTELYKFIIKDVVLDNTKQDVQLVGGSLSYLYPNGSDNIAEQNKVGVWINGVKHSQLDDMTLVYLSTHQNMLFVVIDAGTSVLGNVNVIAVDKNGIEKYNLDTVLDQEQIIDPNAEKNTSYTKVNRQSILRGSVKVDDNAIRFKTYTTQGSACINGYRGSLYAVKYSNGKFEKPTYENGWKYDNSDNCTEAFN